MTFVAFRLARIANEKDANVLGKSIVTLFGIMTTFFNLQVSSYLTLGQRGLAYSLLELKATGVKITASSEAVIARYPVNLKESSFTKKTGLNDKMINYTMSFEKSFSIVNNIR